MNADNVYADRQSFNSAGRVNVVQYLRCVAHAAGLNRTRERFFTMNGFSGYTANTVPYALTSRNYSRGK